MQKRMADCRFEKVKVLGPFFKELEIPEAYVSYIHKLEQMKIVKMRLNSDSTSTSTGGDGKTPI